MLLELAYYGHPILRRKANPITTITDEIHVLVKNMIETMYQYDGGGLAATQVHSLHRLFIIDLYLYQDAMDDNQQETLAATDPTRVTTFINPKIYDPSDVLYERSEGCLSIPGIRGTVTRPNTITVEAMDLQGNLFCKTLTGWQATAVMHENDHLNGVLYIDRMHARERKELEIDLQRIKKKYVTKKK